jgi:hypothetical protein
MSTPGANEHILQFFAFSHLPNYLQEVSKPFSDMAHKIIETIPRNPERTVALRKLLEAKDAVVRAVIAKDDLGPGRLVPRHGSGPDNT